MSDRAGLVLAIAIGLAAAAGCKCHASEPESAEASAKPREPARVPEIPRAVLPASDRVFSVRGADADRDLVIGDQGGALFCGEPDASGEYRVLWRSTGPGELQALVAGETEKGRALYAAFGSGREHRDAPLTLERRDPATGIAETLWQTGGERNEATALAIADIDHDGQPEVVLAHFVSKYEVQAHYIQPDAKVVDGTRARMGISRAYADLDGDGVVDEVIGRLYGDTATEPGDLNVRLSGRTLQIPTDRGVRAVLVHEAKPARPELYFSDGWDANYGRNARAQLSVARFDGERFQTERIGQSAGEYTFFQIFAIESGARRAIIARGSSRVTLFDPPSTPGTPWRATTLASLRETDTIAVGRIPGGRWAVYLSGTDGTRMLPVP